MNQHLVQYNTIQMTNRGMDNWLLQMDDGEEVTMQGRALGLS